MGGGHDARGPMDAEPDVAALAGDRLSRVDPYSHHDPHAVGPRVASQRPLDSDGGGDGVTRVRKGHEEGVALRVDLAPAPLCERRPQQLLVLDEHVVIPLTAERLEQRRRALDVGEEERDRPAVKLLGHGER